MKQLLEIRGLVSGFGGPPAVDGVDIDVGAGEIVGLVGESGSGKSVTALSLLDLLEGEGRVIEGTVRWQGELVDAAARRELRGGQIAMVFQEPLSALNPVHRVGAQIVEALRLHRGLDKRAARARALELLALVDLPAPERRVDAYPHELSGGMRQRVMIAMALAGEPRLLVADEPTTALDATVQAQIAQLLARLRAELSLSVLLITHDLALARRLCQRLYVMYAGQVVESGESAALLSAPRHPYTAALAAALPRLSVGAGADARQPLHVLPMASDEPRAAPGCRFAARCERAADDCRAAAPPFEAGLRCLHPIEAADEAASC
ncbi:MAG: ABC transporter ATP-binding protein [Myxococcales bacterium]|nr:ABC transporter ATP-binding protein [Myxococcales bacterium]